jgi:hypothetical protein
MTNNKQQTAVEWLIEQFKEYDFADVKDTENYIIKMQSFVLTEKLEQAKEMEKEQRAVEIQKFIDKVNEKIDRELGWCGGPRNKSSEMENWRKAYANVRKWMQNLNKEFQQTYGGGKQ